MVSQRTIFTRGGVVVEISMCAPQGCDEWCRVRGYDGWAEASHDFADALRDANEGDTITINKAAGKPFELNKATANVAREGITFVTAGARNIAQLRAAQQAREARGS